MGLVDEIRRKKAQGPEEDGDGANPLSALAPPSMMQPIPMKPAHQAARPSVHEQMAGIAGMSGEFGLSTYHIIPYSSFAGRTKEILLLQNQLHRMVMAKTQPILAIPIQLYEYAQESLFGKRKLPIGELFARELVSVKRLNSDLEKVLSNCHMYVDSLTRFREGLYSEAVESNQSLRALRDDISKMSHAYNRLKNQLGSEPLDQKSLALDQKLEKIEDAKNYAYLSYVLALERISDAAADVKISKGLKRMFVVNYFMYQRMHERAKRMSNRLSHVIGPYLMMIQIQEVGKEVYKQLAAVTSFSRDLHQLASTGISDAVGILLSTTSQMYDNPSNELTHTLNQLQTESAVLNQQLEESMKDNIRYFWGKDT